MPAPTPVATRGNAVVGPTGSGPTSQSINAPLNACASTSNTLFAIINCSSAAAAGTVTNIIPPSGWSAVTSLHNYTSAGYFAFQIFTKAVSSTDVAGTSSYIWQSTFSNTLPGHFITVSYEEWNGVVLFGNISVFTDTAGTGSQTVATVTPNDVNVDTLWNIVCTVSTTASFISGSFKDGGSTTRTLTQITGYTPSNSNAGSTMTAAYTGGLVAGTTSADVITVSPAVSGYTVAIILRYGTTNIAITRTLLWNTLFNISLTRILKWNVFGKITVNQTLLWNTFGKVVKSPTLLWNTLYTLSKTLSLKWKVRLPWIAVQDNSAIWTPVNDNPATWTKE